MDYAEKSRTHYNQVKSAIDHYTVLSFDYAENISLPNKVQEPGIFYFKARRKVELFGVSNEKTNIQHNFLIDECFKISKGPDAVISMLYHYLMHHVLPANDKPHLRLFADNCPGQNKNQTMIGFLCWLVKVMNLFSEIELYFLISGHTKFGPDQHFGRIKNALKSTDCNSILALCGEDGVIQKSASNNFEIFFKHSHTSEGHFE